MNIKLKTKNEPTNEMVDEGATPQAKLPLKLADADADPVLADRDDCFAFKCDTTESYGIQLTLKTDEDPALKDDTELED